MSRDAHAELLGARCSAGEVWHSHMCYALMNIQGRRQILRSGGA